MLGIAYISVPDLKFTCSKLRCVTFCCGVAWPCTMWYVETYCLPLQIGRAHV